MPKHRHGRPALDETEARQVRTLAQSAQAPADWICHAKLVVRSWDGLRTRHIAEELGCTPQTVRERLQAFNERGLAGVGLQPGSGRKPRLTEQERSTILALVHLPPPGKPTYELTGELASWRCPTQQGNRSRRLTPARPPRRSTAARWRAARCGASTGGKACGGAARACGPGARIPTSSPESQESPKGPDRRPLHCPTPGDDRPLCR